ncbi:MAG: CHAT domain-containing protein [Candidatus Obscuribacterales bacterium]|nr:CHAT domain-containing protein [Candidatus Obscuribacterales bacterium]
MPKGDNAENRSDNRSRQDAGAAGIEPTQLNSDKKLRAKSVLVLGGVDFDGGADQASATDRKSGSPILFPPLPGSLVEANKIALLAKKCNFSVVELTGKAASKSNFLKNLAGNSFVHLATHGFFFDESSIGSMGQSMEKKSRGVQIKERIYAGLESRNPLVESGLAFTGANLFSQNTQESKPGVLTAEELVDADMRNCQLVVLSACDTGRGKQLTGQGVLGLRSSVMAAGARNVLMSLWKIPDDVTVLLMDEFYKNLWQENLAPAHALRKAQATLQKQLPPAISKPKFWAGWVLVGEGW